MKISCQNAKIREAEASSFPSQIPRISADFPQLPAKKAPRPKSMLLPKLKYPGRMPEIRVAAPPHPLPLSPQRERGRGEGRPSVPSQRGWHSGTVGFSPVEKCRKNVVPYGALRGMAEKPKMPRATPPMDRERISFFVTNFADEIGGNAHVAVVPAQLRSELLGPGTDAAVYLRIERPARHDAPMHRFS